ncbi:MAG: glycosyltransferase family 39 protein [Deltaproteobacteria bacterium]
MAKAKKSNKATAADAADETESKPEAAEEKAPEAKAPAAPNPASPNPADWLVFLRAKLPTERHGLLAALTLGFLVFIPFLGSVSLWDPWETHYAEVAREMLVRDDFVYPHWESAYFFSKPALPMWMMAFGMWVVGADSGPVGAPLGSLVEWGVRTPFALCAIAGRWGVYVVGRQMRDKVSGVMGALVLGSSAQFIFIGKQAMVDMAFVGPMTAGMALFCLAVFDPDEDRPATMRERGLAAGGIILALVPQLIAIGREQSAGMYIVGLVVAGILGLAFVFYIAVLGSKRDTYLAGFYVLVGLASLAKGPLPLGIVGATVVQYMVFSGDWRVLLRSKVYAGAFLYLLIASPWYLTMSFFGGRDSEGKTFVQRFWLHDVFGRIGVGVHGDRGGIGYYIEQIAYGMFPWVAVIPASLGLAARGADTDETLSAKRTRLFVLLWALLTFVLMTMSQTKFHHYILPALPPLAIMVGYWFVWAAEDPDERFAGYGIVIVAAIFAVVARDLINTPQHLVNLFTYDYTRAYPRTVNARPFLSTLVTVASVAMGLTFLLRRRGQTMLAFAALAAVFGAWVSHHHFNYLSPHWGQAYLFETYFDERQGDEPIYAYQLNWRGETFYSRNRVLQVKEAGANERIRALVDKPGREFIITEQSRFHTLKSVLSPDKRDKLQILDHSNNKFYLCVVEE